MYNCDACGAIRHPDNLETCTNYCGCHYCSDGRGCAGDNLHRIEEGGELYCDECLPKCFLCNNPVHLDTGYSCVDDDCENWYHGTAECTFDFGALTNNLLDAETCLVCAHHGDVELGAAREAFDRCGIDGCEELALLDTSCECSHAKRCIYHFEQHVCDDVGVAIDNLVNSGQPAKIRAALDYLRDKCDDRTMTEALARGGF